MGTYEDDFAHDLFPDERSLKAWAFVDYPILAELEQKKHGSVGGTYAYPVLQQGAIALGTDRTSVQETQNQANDVGGFQGEQFQLGYFKPGYKGGFAIDDFDMALTEGSRGVPDGAYMENLELKLKTINKEFGARQERYFLGLPGRSLALTTANGGTTDFGTGTVKLADGDDIIAFRLGQILNASANDGSGAHTILETGDDAKIFVIGMDYDTGTLSVSSTSGGSAGHSAMDTAAGGNAVYLFNQSDFQGTGGTAPNVLPPGYQDWVTSVAPTGIFQGVTRTNDSRLGGWRLPSDKVAGHQLDDIIKNGLEFAYKRIGVTGEVAVTISPSRWTQLMNLAEGRGYRMLTSETAYFGYTSMELVWGNLRAKIICAPNMSNNDLFFMKLDSWCVRHLNGWPRVMNGDGLKMLRQATADTFEYRIASYYHYGCKAINQNGRADISGVAL